MGADTIGVRIRGMLAVVPTTVCRIEDLVGPLDQEEIKRIVAMTGVREVRRVSPGQTAGDLAYEAATRLLAKVDAPSRDVDGIVFVTQTPDFDLPATACILQARLGLPKQSLAFDVNLGCSAYPYGIAIAGSLISAGVAKRILLLTADTLSKLVHPDDKSSAPLFGDAAAATLLEFDSADNDLLGLDLGTDGEGSLNLAKPVGRSRYRSLAEFTASRPSYWDNVRYPEYLYMDGAQIFSFTLREVPGIVQRTLAAAGLQSEKVDYYFIHQANRFILDHLIRKMRLSAEKCPLSIDHLGNTSGPSPAVTACCAVAEANRGRPLTAMFVGFGVGYSWGGALVHLRPGTLFPLEQVL